MIKLKYYIFIPPLQGRTELNFCFAQINQKLGKLARKETRNRTKKGKLETQTNGLPYPKLSLNTVVHTSINGGKPYPEQNILRTGTKTNSKTKSKQREVWNWSNKSKHKGGGGGRPCYWCLTKTLYTPLRHWRSLLRTKNWTQVQEEKNRAANYKTNT